MDIIQDSIEHLKKEPRFVRQYKNALGLRVIGDKKDDRSEALEFSVVLKKVNQSFIICMNNIVFQKK